MKGYMSDEQLRNFLRENNEKVALILIREFARARTRNQQIARKKQTKEFIKKAIKTFSELS
jgi:hypothetical protein